MDMKMPVDKGLDNTFNLLTEGYSFIQRRCEALQSEVFETRLMEKKMICMTGKDAVRLFYDTELFSSVKVPFQNEFKRPFLGKTVCKH